MLLNQQTCEVQGQSPGIKSQQSEENSWRHWEVEITQILFLQNKTI